MRALLRDAQDQTRIALEVEEAVYDPKDNKLFLYTTSETCYAVSKVVRANADSIIEELVMKGYSDLTQFEWNRTNNWKEVSSHDRNNLFRPEEWHDVQPSQAEPRQRSPRACC